MSECDLCHYEFADSDLYITNASQALCNKCMNTNEPKQEEGYILITAKDFAKYEPKLVTDEWHCKTCGFNCWHNSSTDCFDAELFDPSLTYRRKINPAVVEKSIVSEPYQHPYDLETFEKVYRKEHEQEIESCDRWIKWCEQYNDTHGMNFHQGMRAALVFYHQKMQQLLSVFKQQHPNIKPADLAAKTLKEVE